MTDLFAPVRLGSLELKNRFVMAPMTRNRAGAGTAPTALNAEYYAQRAGAGLIVTEGTQPSAVGQGYPGTPVVPGLERRDLRDCFHLHRERVHLTDLVVGDFNGVLPHHHSALVPRENASVLTGHDHPGFKLAGRPSGRFRIR